MLGEEVLLDLVLPHVPFDGFSRRALLAAGVGQDVAPVDLAVAWHRRLDRDLAAWLAATDLSGLRFRERVAAAVRQRVEAMDREVARRAAALFLLPQHVTRGARAAWSTADVIWTGLGDSSADLNYYSKRLILSGVYGATATYWYGDTSPGAEASWAFLDRRIEDVMRFEELKARLGSEPLQRLAESSGLNRLVARLVEAQRGAGERPGRWQP